MRIPGDSEVANGAPVPQDDNRMDWQQERPDGAAAWHFLENSEGSLHARPTAKPEVGRISAADDERHAEKADPSRDS